MRQTEITVNEVYHIYNRGTSRRNIYLSHGDYLRFIKNIEKYSLKYRVQVLVYCLMPNHFHLLLSSSQKEANIPMFMKSLQCSHSHYFNKKYNHSGHVFQGAYKNKLVTNDPQLSTLVQYILDNPVRKKLVSNIKEWAYWAIVDKKSLTELGGINET